MRTLKITVAYDGAAYAGWQYQCDVRTVQETLESAIAKVTGGPVRVLASGRTDAGVHALGQVVRVSTESVLSPHVLQRAINANLPPDIAVLDVVEVPEGFHPTRHALRKRYRYVIHDGPVRDVFNRQYVWNYSRGRLDAEAMHRAAAALLGTHDFRSFESSDAPRATSVRTIFDITVRRGRAGQGDGAGDSPIFVGRKSGQSPSTATGDYISIEVEADGFLYNMVRAIVGTLVQVGCGCRPESWPAEVLGAANRRAAGPTAPPQGLFLVRVEYEECEDNERDAKPYHTTLISNPPIPRTSDP